MSLKKSLLVGCVFFGAVGVVHSQTSMPAASPEPAATTLLDAVSSEPMRLPSPAAERTAVQPKAPQGTWFLDKPKAALPALGQASTALPKGPDESALRYYASQNDLARVSAEIRRIRTSAPGWEPPADLFSQSAGTEEEQPLWDLFAKGDLAGVKARIAEIQDTKPDWQPSSGLSAKLHNAEVRIALVQASDAKQWGTVIDLASDNRSMLACADIDVLWRTAEALIGTGDETRGADAYRYILANCANPAERLATVQKASLLIKDQATLDGLVAMGRMRSDGRSEFESVRLDAVRQRVGTATAAKVQASAPDLDALSQDFASSRSDNDAQILGWYNYGRQNLSEAERWFRAAMDVKSTPKAAEGLVLALRDQGKTSEAQDLAVRFMDADPLNRKQVIELVSAELVKPKAIVRPDIMKAFVAAVEAAQSGDGAQAYAWNLYNAGDAALASEWFKKSLAWQPSEEAVVGLIVSDKKLNRSRDYAEHIAQYRASYPKVAELEALMRPRPGTGNATRGRVRVARADVHRRRRTDPTNPRDGRWDATADQIVTVYKSGQYDQALAMMDQRRTAKAEPHGLTIVRGWAQYNKGDWDGAQRTFAAVKNTQVSSEAEDGLRQVQLGYTNPRFR